MDAYYSFFNWLKVAFDFKSIVVCNNWGPFFFLYLSFYSSKDAERIYLETRHNAGETVVSNVSFLWTDKFVLNASGSIEIYAGMANQLDMQTRANRRPLYTGNMVLLPMQAFATASSKLCYHPLFLDIDDPKTKYAIKRLFDILEMSGAIESSIDVEKSTMHKKLDSTIVHPAFAHVANVSDSFFYNSRHIIQIPSTIDEMEICCDLAV